MNFCQKAVNFLRKYTKIHAKRQTMKEKIFFKTFGCRTNIYDTELLKGFVKDYELTNDESKASVVVVNSCTVTNGADSGVRAYIKSLQNRGVRVVLTGCGAMSRGRELFEKGAVFGVLGASVKHKINDFLATKREFYELGESELSSFIDKDIVSRFESHTKAFVKVQEGCDYGCSYCIIPAVRGKSRSMPQEKLVSQVQMLANNGYTEFVLTGTNIGSYGVKDDTSLGRLLQALGTINGVKRIRLGSLEPAQIDDSFKDILGEPWLERHLHIALQHTSEKMLRLMRRRSHTRDDLALFELLHSKDFALGTDFIVAHPGESVEIWDEALENFKKFKLTHLHAFIFSPRSGTHSASMKNDISGDTAKSRLNALKNIVKRNNFEFRRGQGALNVLVEGFKNGFYEGYDEFYNKIKIKSDENLSKKWLKIEHYEVRENGNFAEF